jgi:hypothetical protein
MILNAYAVLDAFLSLLRLGLSLVLVVSGISFWWISSRYAVTAEKQKALEDRTYLLYLMASLLLVLNILSWPLLYLLLQSYVIEWPGVMCIYGVTQIGVGTLGSSRFLPPLLTALQLTKPALVFVSGAWFVLYLVNHNTRTAPLTRRVVFVLLAAGILGFVDAAGEITYLLIPKKEVFSSAGCCTEIAAEQEPASRFVPPSLVAEDKIPFLYWAFYVGNGLQLLALCVTRRLFGQGVPKRLLALLAVGSGLCLTISALFLVEVAAPRLLHLPYHHCAYDLVPKVPESVVAVALYVAGAFSVGWGGIAGFLGNKGDAGLQLPMVIKKLLYLGLLGLFLSVVMLSVELVLA